MNEYQTKQSKKIQQINQELKFCHFFRKKRNKIKLK